MKLYRTAAGAVVEDNGQLRLLKGMAWDDLVQRDDVRTFVQGQGEPVREIGKLLAPIDGQEVWAAGVTYWRSREARMEEAQAGGGGGSFYDRVYSAQRPELFYKSAGWRVIGHGGQVRIRTDSKWNVPEPELTLMIAPSGKITGYTIGNDMSSRDIEGENPLYLPQAKVYNGSCALGPCVLLAEEALGKETRIAIRIARRGSEVFAGATDVGQIKRTMAELAGWLTREMAFPAGVFLMTGTGVVPPEGFTLASGDEICITIDGIGELVNRVGGDAE